MARLSTDARRAQLLELGLDLFSRHTYDEVSIDDIAREAEVSKGLLYHYFGGKRAFYAAVVDHAAGNLLDGVHAEATGHPGDRVRRGLTAYLDFVHDHRTSFLALMSGGLGVDPEIEAIVARTRQAFVERILDQLPLPEPPPLLRVGIGAWIGAVEAASLAWLRDGAPERDALVEVLVGTLRGTLAAALEQTPGGAAAAAQLPLLLDRP